jgi:hypothetical protein
MIMVVAMNTFPPLVLRIYVPLSNGVVWLNYTVIDIIWWHIVQVPVVVFIKVMLLVIFFYFIFPYRFIGTDYVLWILYNLCCSSQLYSC